LLKLETSQLNLTALQFRAFLLGLFAETDRETSTPIRDGTTMKMQNATKTTAPTREEMVRLLNEDLAREYQAIIAYVVYSQVLKGAAYNNIAKELEKHAGEELDHALRIAKQVDYLGGMPVVVPKQVKTSEDAKEMLGFDLDNEQETIKNYRQRIQQAEAMGEYALSEELREIIVQEQEHLMDLADALGIDAPQIR
jgi:bacterioferritin